MVSKRVSALFALLWLIVALSAPVFGVPANSKVWTFTQPDGTKFQAVLRGDEFYSYHETLEGDIIQRDSSTGQWRYARPRGNAALEVTSVPVGKGTPPAGTKTKQMAQWLEAVENAADQRASQMLWAPGAARATGTVRGVLLLANFRDTSTKYAVSDFNDLMNAAGGVKDYYLEASYGKLTLQIDVYGWFLLPNNHDYYGGNTPDERKDDPARIKQMILDTIKEAGPTVDFSKYDGDGDGWVDLLGVAHQGQGEEQGGADSDCIWSRMDFLSEAETVDGVRISAFFTAPERYYEGLTTIGMYCHEIGHIFRVPDLYDYDNSSLGVGDWSVMGSGNWLGWFDRDGSRPCHFDPWCKYVLGWVTPEVIDTPRSGIVLPSFDTHPTVLLIPIDPYQDGEYFLVANRYGREGGFDEYLSPWPGVLILHVDDYVPNNDNEVRKKVDVEEADGLRELDTRANPGEPSDLYMWPESVFDDASEPNSRDNDGISTGITIRNFAFGEDMETMTCDVTPQTFLNGYSIFYDSIGPWGNYGRGYGDGDDYACVRFLTDQGGILERVKTYFRYDGTTDYTVNVYSGWLNNKPTGLLTTQPDSHTGTGYEEIVLLEPQAFAEGAEFIVEIRYNTAGGDKWPIPLVNDGNCSGRTYVRSTDTAGYYQFTLANEYPYDALIRADLRPFSLAPALRLDVKASNPLAGSTRRDPEKATYGYFETVTLEAIPAPGCLFVGWSGDLESSSNPATITMDSDKVVIANFLDNFGGDLVDVNDANYPPLVGLAPGSPEAQERQREVVRQLKLPLEVRSRNTGIVFRLIPAGSFTMGSPSSESGRDEDETQHEVTLTHAFYCAKFEVTRGQWEQVTGRLPLGFNNTGSDAPAVGVSITWNACQNFLKKLCQKEQVPEGTYRLLTEAEWEYACRAGTQTPFCYGSDLDANMANFNGNYPYGNGGKGEFRNKPVQVGSFQPNAWGLYDMHGNAHEWCQDCYAPYPSGSVTDPLGPTSAFSRVIRGGSYADRADSCRSASRANLTPTTGQRNPGLRIARVLPIRP